MLGYEDKSREENVSLGKKAAGVGSHRGPTTPQPWGEG